MSDDRYGISAYFEFVEKSGSLATIDRVESALKRLENTVKGTAQTVAGANLGQSIGQQFKGVQGAVQGASNSVQSFGRSASQAGSALTPLRSEFRALRAESRNIDFGDLNDPQAFNAARQSLHQYVAELQKLHDQIQGDTTVDRQFKAELVRGQTIATNRGNVAEIQRSSAVASQRAGTATAIAGGAAAVALPMVKMGTDAVNITAGFDDQMSAVEAVLTAQDRTSENMLKLREQAKGIGAATKFSATDAAAGLVLLAQSGQSVQEQLKSIAGTTLLAAAGGLDLAAATDITVSSLGQFGLKADQAVHVANVLAYNAAAANLGVADLGESLKYAGPAASAFGATFEETNAILDVFSESGIKGSGAGTALKTMFINLASPSKQAEDLLTKYNITVKDSAGKMLPTVSVMDQLQSKLSGLSSGDQLDAVSTIFGKEATPAALSIVNGGATKIKGYLDGGKDADTVKGARGSVGSAAVQAGIMENNVGGSFRNLSSAIEGIQIEMGEILIPAIRSVTDTLSGLLTRFIDLPKPIKTAITVAAALVTGLAAITTVAASAAAVFFTLQSAIGASAIAEVLMSSTLVPLTGFANAAIASFGVSGLSGVMGVLTGGVTGAGAAIGTFAAGALAVITSPMAIATAGTLALYAALEILTPGFNVLGAVIGAIAAPLGIVFGIAQGIAAGVGTALAPVISQFAGLKIAGTGVAEAFTIAGKVFSDFAVIGSTVGNVIGMVLGITIATPLRGLIALFGWLSASAETFGRIGGSIAAPFLFAAQTVTNAWTGFVNWFMSMPLVKFAQDLGIGLINALNHNPTVKIPIAWKGAMKAITGMFTGLLTIGKIIGAKLVSAFNPIGIVQMLPGAIGGILESFAGLIFGAFSIVGAAVMSAISSPVISVLAVGASVIEGLRAIWTGFTDWLTGALMAVPNAVSESFSKILPPFLRNKKGAETPVPRIINQSNQSIVPVISPIENRNDTSIVQALKETATGPNQTVSEPVNSIVSTSTVKAAPTKILPVIQAMAIETSNVVQSSFDKLDLTPAIVTAKASFDGFGAIVQTVRSQFGGLVQSALMFGVTTLLSLSPTVLIFGGIALAIAVVTSNFLGLRTIAIGIGKVFTGLFETLRGIVETLRGITRAVGAVGSGISGIIGGIPAALKGDFSVIEGAFNDMTAGLKVGFNGILSGAGRVGAGIEKTFSGVLQIARGVGEGLGQVVAGITATIKAIPIVISSVASSIESTWKAVSGFVSSLPIEPSIEFLKALPSKVSELFDRTTATVKSAVEYVRSLPFIPSIEELKSLPSVISGVLDRATAAVKSAVEYIGNLPFMPSIESLKSLPSKVSELFDRATAAVKSAVEFIGNLPFMPSIESLKSLPSKVSELFDRATAAVKGAVEHVGNLPFVPSLDALKNLPITVSGVFDRATAAVKSAVEFVGNLPFIPSIERLKSLPSEVSAIVDRTTAAVKSAVEFVGNLPFVPSIEAIKALPSKVSEVFDRVTNSIKSAIAMVSEIWQSLRLPFPEINLQNISEIPSRIGGMIDSAIGFFKGGVEQISAVWGGLKTLDSMPLLEGTINLLKSLPATFEAVVEKIKSMWGGLGEKFGGILGGMGDKAKSIGKSFVSALSENSPGPTYQIRLKWAATTAAIGENLEALKGEAKIKGQHIADSLSGPLESAKSKGASALGRSASSIGMVLSNFAPNLAAPLFAIGDMVDTVDTLSTSLPEAKKFFGGLIPEAGKLKGAIGGMLPVLGEGMKGAAGKAAAAFGEMATNIGPMSGKVLKAIGPMSKTVMSSIGTMGSSVLSTVIPMAGTVMSSIWTMAGTVLSAVIPMVGTVISAIVSMAGAVASAVIPLVLPFLPIIAVVGAVVGAIALLKVAFDNDFLGIKTAVFGVGDAIKNTFTNAFSFVTGAVFGVRDLIKNGFTIAFDAVKSAVFGVGDAIKNTFTNALNSAFALAGTIAAAAVATLTGLWDGFASWLVDRFMAIPNAIGGALSSLVPGFLKKKDESKGIPGSSIEETPANSAPMMNPIAGAANRIQGAWTGFGEWFGGAMGGLVAEGEGAGEGLVNALNHNPTVRIPIAWEGATSRIGGMLGGMLDFAAKTGEGFVSMLGGAARIVGGSFRQLGSVLSGFGLGSLVSLFPVLAVMGGLALVALAVSTNFLGLRSIATGAFMAISGAIEGTIAMVRGLVESVQGVITIIRGVIAGDIDIIAMGFDRLFGGIHSALMGAGDAVRSVFGGVLTFVQGVFEGFGTSGKNTFNGIVSAAQTLGEALKLATQSPIALWNGFLDLLDSVQSKIQGVGTAIASSPIGALAGGLKAKFGGKSATVVDGVDGAEFDQKIQAIAPPEQPKRMNRLRSFFSKPVAEPLPSAGPQPFIRVDDPVISPIQPTISDRVGSMFSAPKPIAPQDNLQVTAGTSPTTEPIQPTISDQVRSVFPAPKPIAPQATPQATADNSLTSSPIAGKEALMGATDTVGALSSVASIVAPNFAGPLAAIGGLLSSVLTLTTVIPVLSGTIATLATGFTAAGGITGLLSLGMTGLSSVFGTVTATATAAWAAVTGPLLPIVAAIALVVATVGLVYVAFQNNFLGIADLVGGVVGVFGAFFGAIVSGFSEIFGGIVDQLQQSIGGIFTQLQVLGQVIVKPFEPLMTLFGGGGDGLGSAIAMTVGNALIPFKIMATAIGFVVGTIGKVIEVVVAVGTVIADIILQPMSAIVGVVATVFSAIGRLGSAIMQPFSALGEAWDKLTGGIAGAGNESAQFGDMIRSMANNALLPLRMVFGAIGLAISGVGFAVEMLIQGFTTMAQVVLLPVTAIGFLINGIVAVGGVLGTALTTPLNLITGLFTGFITMLGTIPAILMQPFNAISGIIGGIASAIALVGSAIAGIPFIGGIFSAITGVQAAPQQETQYFADGGRVQGSGVGDRVDAKLTPGEFVVTPGPAAAALPMLEALNAGGIGGMLSAMPMMLPQMIPAPIAVPVAAGSGGGGFGDIAVNLNVANITVSSGGGAGDSPQAQAMEILDQLAPHLRRAVADILRDLVEKTR